MITKLQYVKMQAPLYDKFPKTIMGVELYLILYRKIGMGIQVTCLQ